MYALCFLTVFDAQGIIESSRGPTLGDLAQHLHSTLHSHFIAVGGSAFGALLCMHDHGLIVDNEQLSVLSFNSTVGCASDKFPKAIPWFIFSYVVTFGVSTALATTSDDVNVFYTIWFIHNVGYGGIATGCYVYCLGIWREHGGAGPWLHSVHLAMALGLGIGPLITEPFLSDDESGI